MSRWSVVAGGICLAGWLAVASGQEPVSIVVLPNVTVIDGTGALPRAAMTIVVRDGQIADIYRTGDREPPAGARVLPTDGRFVTPGFIDTHVHLATTERPHAIVESLLRATLLGGVTTVRDMGGNGDIVGPLRDASRSGAVMSPSIHAAAVFAGPRAFWFTERARVGFLNAGESPGSTPWLVKVDTGTDIRAAVRRAKAWGAAGIAVSSHLTARQVRTIADEARRERLPVWSHAAVGATTPRDLVEARVSTLSPAGDLIWHGRTGLAADQFGTPAALAQALDAVRPNDPTVLDLLGRMRERNVALEPTLYIGMESSAFAAADRPVVDRQLAWAAAVTDLARQLGVTVVTGTDAVGGSSPNLHVELQLLVNRAGFSPLQALRAATFDAARALGLADSVGSLAVGRRADLVVLVRNPVDDIRNTQTIVMVLRAGVVHERVDPMPPPPLAEAPGR